MAAWTIWRASSRPPSRGQRRADSSRAAAYWTTQLLDWLQVEYAIEESDPYCVPI